MPKIEMLQDFQGVETNNVFYTSGQVLTIGEHVPDSVASRLLADGRAKRVHEPVSKSIVVEMESTTGTATNESAFISTEPQRLPDVVIDGPAPVMTSTTQHTTRNRHGKR